MHTETRSDFTLHQGGAAEFIHSLRVCSCIDECVDSFNTPFRNGITVFPVKSVSLINPPALMIIKQDSNFPFSIATMRGVRPRSLGWLRPNLDTPPIWGRIAFSSLSSPRRASSSGSLKQKGASCWTRDGSTRGVGMMSGRIPRRVVWWMVLGLVSFSSRDSWGEAARPLRLLGLPTGLPALDRLLMRKNRVSVWVKVCA